MLHEMRVGVFTTIGRLRPTLHTLVVCLDYERTACSIVVDLSSLWTPLQQEKLLEKERTHSHMRELHLLLLLGFLVLSCVGCRL